MTQPVDISQLSVQELLVLRENINTQMVTRQQVELDKLRADVLELCASRGYTLQQVMAPLRKTAPRKATGADAHFVKGKTYQNPANLTQTWQGFGQRPTWVRDHLAGGGTVAQLELSSAPVTAAAEPPAATPAPVKAVQKPAAKKSAAKKPAPAPKKSPAKPAAKKAAAPQPPAGAAE